MANYFDMEQLDDAVSGVTGPMLLPRARAKAQSPGGVLSNTVQPGQGSVLPNAIDALRKRATDLYAQGEQLYNAEPDMGQLQEFARRRGSEGNAAMMNALAAQFAGEGFAPLQSHLLKKAAESNEAMKVGGGILTADGQYIKDPIATRDKRAEFLLQQAKAYEQMAETARTRQEQQLYREQQDRAMNSLRDFMAQTGRMNADTQRMNALTAQIVAGNNTNKPPAGYQFKPDGTLTFIPGGPADPKTVEAKGGMTEDMRKSAGYAFRMDNALRLIKQLTGDDPTAQTPNLIPTLAGKIPIVGDTAQTVLTTTARQRVENAQLDALDAALTLATGAAYTKEQLKGLAKSYFPQYGETNPQVIADKRKRLAEIIETAKMRAGRAYPEGGQPGAAPAGGDDPSDPFGIRGKKGN